MKVKELVNKLQTKWIRIYVEHKEDFSITELFNASEDELNDEVISYMLEPYLGDILEDIDCNMYIRIK